jgi:hypothetical protein
MPYCHRTMDALRIAMTTNTDARRSRPGIYFLMLSIQTIAAFVFVWSEVPSFRQLARNPGKQIPDSAFNYLATAIIPFPMLGAYWYRQLYIEIPLYGSNTLLHHILLFFSRLSFALVPRFFLSYFSGTSQSLVWTSIFCDGPAGFVARRVAIRTFLFHA